jgi:hypothetical protein
VLPAAPRVWQKSPIVASGPTHPAAGHIASAIRDVTQAT